MSTEPTNTITCPFLALASPDTSHPWRFARSCNKHGMEYWMPLFVTY
jgi:hypothetical protein